MDDQIESVGSETVNPFSAPQSEGPGANAGQTTAQPTKLGHIRQTCFPGLGKAPVGLHRNPCGLHDFDRLVSVG